MTKQRARRAPLAVVIGLIAFLAVPAVAQAHSVSATASCELSGQQAVVTLEVTFSEFTLPAQSSLRGRVWLDGVDGSERAWTDAAPPLNWSVPGGTATLVTSWNVDGGFPYTAKYDFTWATGGGNQGAKGQVVTATCPDTEPEPDPAIALVKTGAATATAGSTFTYSFTATNTGNVTLTNVVLSDPKCETPLVRVAPNADDDSFDPGDAWSYTCTVTAPAGPAQVDNVATVCGDHVSGDVTEKVCDDDPHTFTVPPPGNPPGENPPGGNPPPSSTPNVVPPAGDGEVAPERIVSGRASLRGPSGCVRQAFTARVRGRSIASVTFFVDGRRVKRDTRAAFTVKVNPKRYGLGRHRVEALVRFTAASGTSPRRLPLTFRRCAQQPVAPRFTG